MRKLPPLPTISEIVRLYRLQARKQLSQNFLLDMNLCRKLVKKAGDISGGHVCEVGPGPGGITRAILERDVERLTLIEKDPRFLPGLQVLADATGVLDIHRGDILDFHMEKIFPESFMKQWEEPPPNIHIIGNLPFSVSTPLIVKWLENIANRNGAWKYGRTKLTLTFQKEVANRIVSPANKDTHCRLSIMCQYLCNVKVKFEIPGKAFVPAPDVDVSVVQFTPRKHPLINQPFKLVERVCRHVYHYKNKKCIRGIETLFPTNMPELALEMLEEANVSKDVTAVSLTVPQINRLCDVYADICDRVEGIYEFDYRSPENKKLLRRKRDKDIQRLEKKILQGSESDSVGTDTQTVSHVL